MQRRRAALRSDITPYSLGCQLSLEKAMAGSLGLDYWDRDTFDVILDELHSRLFRIRRRVRTERDFEYYL